MHHFYTLPEVVEGAQFNVLTPQISFSIYLSGRRIVGALRGGHDNHVITLHAFLALSRRL